MIHCFPSTLSRFDICQLCWQEPALRPTMDELLMMLKDPSTVKRRRRSSSLTRQNYIGLPPSRSRTMPPATKGEPSRNEPQPSGEDTLKRKPRRPAPTLPPSRAVKQAPAKSRLVLDPESTRPAQGMARPVPVPEPVRQSAGNARPVPEQEPVRQAPPQPPVMGAMKTYSLKRPAPKKPGRAEEKGDSLEDVVAGSTGVSGRLVGVGNGRPKDAQLQMECGVRGQLGNNQVAGGYISGQGADGQSIGQVAGVGSVSVEPLEAWNDADGADMDMDMVYSADVEEILDDSVFVSGLDAMADAGGDQDFILEPPDDFSQSSIYALDVAASSGASEHETDEKVSPLMTVQLHSPAVRGESSAREGPAQVEGGGFPSVGHDQGEGLQGDGDNFPDERSDNRGEVWPDEGRDFPNDTPLPLQHQVADTSAEHKNGKAKKSKKKRESKDYSEPGSKKHKSKKKRKRRSASTDDLVQRSDSGLPEYELDRGLDRVPMRTAKDRQESFRTGQLGAWVDGRVAIQTGSRFSQEEPEGPRETSSFTKGGSKLRASSSYENVMADDDISPPWLHDGNPSQSQELSFDELDVYADEDEQDEPRVVYKEDVASLVW